MSISFAVIRRACVPALTLGLLSIGLVVPAALADSEPTPAPTAQASVASAEAEAVAEAKSTSREVVVDAATTPTSVTTALPDGTLSTTINNEPVRMQTKDGWADISTDLVQATVDGVSVLKPENVPVDITVSTGGTSEIATLDDKDGHSISQSWPFGILPTPIVEGNSATYRQVLPGVDLIQLANKSGISQVLKIETAEAAKDPRVAQMRILLDTHNLAVEQSPDGDLTAKESGSTDVVLHNSGGFWWDSKAQGASATDPGGHGIPRPFSLSLGTEGDKKSQIFDMQEILQTDGLQYPVYIDPDWTFTTPTWLFTDSAYPTVSYWNGTNTDGTSQVQVGYLQPLWAPDRVPHTARAYFQFNTASLAGRDIINARLSTVETWASSCTPTDIASWVTDGVDSTTRWYAQPSLASTNAIRTDIGAVAKGWGPNCPAGTVGFDLMAAKNLLKQRSVWTVALVAGNESDILSWKKFTKDAYITVTHNLPPNLPVFQSVTNGKWYGTPWTNGAILYTRDTQPTFTVQFSDPDGYIGDNITAQMSLWQTNGQQVGGDFTVGGVNAVGTNLDYKAPPLGDGTYTLRARSWDRWNGNSAVMSVVFVVDTTAPATPTIKALSPVPNAPSGWSNDLGQIGKTEYKFELSTPVDSAGVPTNPAEGFIFATTAGDVQDAPPAAGMGCTNNRVKEFVVVCPGYGQKSTITITPMDNSTSLTVWAFDVAGNVNEPTKGAPAHYIFKVSTKPTEPTTMLDLELTGGAEWKSPNQTTPCGPAPGTLPGAERLNFPTGAAVAETVVTGSMNKQAVDTAQSFTVSAWVCAQTPNSGSIQSLIGQLGGTNSSATGALRLGNTGKAELGSWVVTSDLPETVSTDVPLQPGDWTYVNAVFDKINAQLRVTVSNDGLATTWVKAAAAPATRAASTTIQPARIGGNFVGEIYRPVLTQGVLNDEALRNIQLDYGTKKGLLK